jgi:hypothetical protein
MGGGAARSGAQQRLRRPDWTGLIRSSRHAEFGDAPAGGRLTAAAGATSSGTQQSPEGTEVLQRLWAKTLPVPLPSQKMSGSLPLMTFAFTTFPFGGRPAERSGVDDSHPTLERRGARWRGPGYEVAGHEVVVRTKERDAKSRQKPASSALLAKFPTNEMPCDSKAATPYSPSFSARTPVTLNPLVAWKAKTPKPSNPRTVRLLIDTLPLGENAQIPFGAQSLGGPPGSSTVSGPLPTSRRAFVMSTDSWNVPRPTTTVLPAPRRGNYAFAVGAPDMSS